MSVIMRYSKPTHLDQLPYGTVIKSDEEGERCRYFLQVSKEESNPEWLSIGDLLEIIYCGNTDDEHLTDLFLMLYEQKDIIKSILPPFNVGTKI
jgi:hypothetical protein